MSSEEYLEGIRAYRRGRKILGTFKQAGFKPHQTDALITLYELKNCSRQELKQIIGVKNEGFFTHHVINPLKSRGVIVVEATGYFQPKMIFVSTEGEE